MTGNRADIRQPAKSKVSVCRLVTVAMLAVISSLIIAPSTSAQDSTELLIERTYTEKLSYRCLIHLPVGYSDDSEKAWPLVLFLHGGGTPQPKELEGMTAPLSQLPAIVVTPMCPLSADGPRYTNWNWKILGEVVREIGEKYRVDSELRSVIGFSMGGSGAWELPSFEPELFSKSVVIAGVCHPWSLRHYPRTQVWVFSGLKDYMRKEQQETVTSAKRFKVDVVESTWKDADHGGVFKNAIKHRPLLDWLVTKEDLRKSGEITE